MKVRVEDGDHWGMIDLIPETPEEMALLARIAINAKAEKPWISLDIGKTPTLMLMTKKIKKLRRSIQPVGR